MQGGGGGGGGGGEPACGRVNERVMSMKRYPGLEAVGDREGGREGEISDLLKTEFSFTLVLLSEQTQTTLDISFDSKRHCALRHF